MAQIVISLQDNGMVVLSKIFDGCAIPVIWFENLEYFDEFIRMARTMSYYFKLKRKKNDLPVEVKNFIEQLDMRGI